MDKAFIFQSVQIDFSILLDQWYNKSLLKESTLYVNLEPCSHEGKTPPCADLLIHHNVKKVVVSNLDSNPLVAGEGIKKLRVKLPKQWKSLTLKGIGKKKKTFTVRYVCIFLANQPLICSFFQYCTTFGIPSILLNYEFENATLNCNYFGNI